MAGDGGWWNIYNHYKLADIRRFVWYYTKNQSSILGGRALYFFIYLYDGILDLNIDSEKERIIKNVHNFRSENFFFI